MYSWFSHDVTKIQITKLLRVFAYLPSFNFQILDLNGFIFILIYFEWRDTENQQLSVKSMELLEVWVVTQPFCPEKGCKPGFREVISFQITSLLYVLFRFEVFLDHYSTSFKSFLTVVLLVGHRFLIFEIVVGHFGCF